MVFKIKDLMITDLAAARGGSVGKPTPTEPTPPTTISPIAAAALQSPKLQYALEGRLAQIDAAYIDKLAYDVGKAVIGTAIVGLCMQDQTTCDANPQISPFASEGDFMIRTGDFATLVQQVESAADWVQTRSGELEQRTLRDGGELAHRLREAADILERGGKG